MLVLTIPSSFSLQTESLLVSEQHLNAITLCLISMISSPLLGSINVYWGQKNTHHWHTCIEISPMKPISNCLALHPRSCCRKKLALQLIITVYSISTNCKCPIQIISCCSFLALDIVSHSLFFGNDSRALKWHSLPINSATLFYVCPDPRFQSPDNSLGHEFQ